MHGMISKHGEKNLKAQTLMVVEVRPHQRRKEVKQRKGLEYGYISMNLKGMNLIVIGCEESENFSY